MASVSDTREHSSGRFRTSWWDRDGGILKLAAVVMLSWSCASAPNPAGVRAPIIDMHLHAVAADSQGPPPVAICTPIDPFPVWDPQRPYRETWIAMLKQPACSDPVWSPETDEAVMSATIEVMSRLNIYGAERYARAGGEMEGCCTGSLHSGPSPTAFQRCPRIEARRRASATPLGRPPRCSRGVPVSVRGTSP